MVDAVLTLLAVGNARLENEEMGQFLFYYQRPEPATWVYMSSFLIVGIFFVFHRLWSIRNLDIILLLLLTPGLMAIHESYRMEAQKEAEAAEAVKSGTVAAPVDTSARRSTAGTVYKLASFLAQEKTPQQFVSDEQAEEANSTFQATAATSTQWSSRAVRRFGYIWLLSVCLLWLIRMLLDTTFFRRPFLEANLSKGGLVFIGVSLLTFLMANILNGPVAPLKSSQINRGPGFDPLKALPDIATTANPPGLGSAKITLEDGMKQERLATVSRVLLMVANTILVLGMVAIGLWHFSDLKAGVGAALLYLLLPYASQMIGRIEHAIPGSLLVLAVLLYRRPFFSGAAIGLAGGLVFYPLFLIPLWLSFYWQRGQRRYLAGVISAIAGLVIALAFASNNNFFFQLRQMFGTVSFQLTNLDGIWGLGMHPYVRIPVVVAFVAIAFSFAFWPAQKSLATLLNCSAAIMVAAQFGYAFGGGLLMAWYLPLILLTVFRPNLDDLVASQAVRQFRLMRRREPPQRPNVVAAD